MKFFILLMYMLTIDLASACQGSDEPIEINVEYVP